MSDSSTQSIPDIRADGGIIPFLPATWRPYALLMRLDRPVGTWLLLLPGWWGILSAAPFSGQSALYMVLFGIGAVLMRGAGCVINDLWDRDFDRQVARTRTRPLAAGDLSPRAALLFLLVLLAVSFLILLFFNRLTVAIGVASLIPVILYPLAKRVTWYPQAVLGLTFNMGALMGTSAMTGSLTPSSVLLYLAGLFWTLGYDTIYAGQDMADDALIGVKSTALRFGEKVKIWIGAFYTFCSILILWSGFLSGAGPVFYLLALAGAAHLARQVVIWNREAPSSALSVFRSNRDFGLIIAAAFLLA